MNTPFLHITRLAAGLILLLAMLCAACVDMEERAIHTHAYDLCDEAYKMRYVNIDSCATLAHKSLSLVGDNPNMRARALGELAFASYIRMDYTQAHAYLDTITTTCNNQLDLVCADVMRMKIAQRLNDGRQFFEARGRVEQRLARIHQERSELDDRGILRAGYAESEYHIISSTYYYYQRQDSASRAEMEQVLPIVEESSDTAQRLNYYYMVGSGGILEGDTDKVAVEEFDLLCKCYIQSRACHNLYFMANSLQALAATLLDTTRLHLIKQQRPEILSSLAESHQAWMADSLHQGAHTHTSSLGGYEHLPHALALHSLQVFSEYGDDYQTACVYRTLGEICFQQGRYEESLSEFQAALDLISLYHARYYGHATEYPRLLTFDPTRLEGQSTELLWIQDPTIASLPEWMAGIRQQICMVYSALGQKQASDYNRNIYLDIIENENQDEELQSINDDLTHQIKALEWTLIGVFLLLTIVVAMIVRYARHLHRRNEQEMHLRQTILAYCNTLSAKEAETACTAEGGENFERLMRPYTDFLRRNRELMLTLTDALEDMEEEKAIARHKLLQNKEENAERRAKVSMVYAIVPFLDRIIAEVDRMHLKGIVEESRIAYIVELTEQIIIYNDILTSWIQMSQGQLSLQITTIHLNTLLDILRRGHFAYDQAGITLEVDTTEASVKADEALTLFMLNTLADNARKFTPRGGSVHIGVTEEPTYVELSVTDTGRGLSPEDVDTLNNEKVYDPAHIGREATDGKGFGFGLMNCRGIMEKYKKTSPIFSECLFGVESQQGRGSRFYFRLPRVLTLLIAVLSIALSTRGAAMPPEALYDSVYDANVEGRYDEALFFAHQAIHQCDTADLALMADLHNEAAISALALCKWAEYSRHNSAYTRLMKRMNQDKTLPEKYRQLARAHHNTRLAILFLCLIALTTGLMVYMLLRKRVNLSLDLRQLSEINDALTRVPEPTGEDIQTYADTILGVLYRGLSQLYRLDGMTMQVDSTEGDHLIEATIGAMSAPVATHPLTICSPTGEHHVIGQVAISGQVDASDSIIALSLSYVALVVYNALVCTSQQANHIYQIEDERNRITYEQQRLHVRNQILDNCLSTIKHESMYYPARIQQLARRLLQAANFDNRKNEINASVSSLDTPTPNPEAERDDIHQLYELTHYYKSIYTVLSSQAERQTSLQGFRPQRLSVAAVISFALTNMRLQARRLHSETTLTADTCDPSLSIWADQDLIHLLIKRLLEGTLRLHTTPDHLHLRAEADGIVVRFTLTAPAWQLTEEQMHTLFMPRPDNIPYLIVRQIIRDHDTFSRQRGLRMLAQADEGGGTAIIVTLPAGEGVGL